MATNTAAIQALYVAYFNRPADVAGLAYWDPIVTAAKGDTTNVSKAFAASAEYKATYAGLDAYHIVAAVYQNLFGHQPDTAGLNFWGQNLLNGKMTIDNVVTAIAAGAQGSDKFAYNDKITAATAFTNALTTSAQQLGYGGDAANAAAKAWMSTIVDDASLAAAIDPTALANAINVVITPVPVQFSLTAGVDTLVGTAGNDVFNATVTGATPTLGAFDSIDGGAGNNTLSILDTTTNGVVALPSNTTIKNIQNLVVAATSSGGANLDGTTISGLNSIKLTTTDASGTAADVVKANAGSAVTVNSNGGTVTVDGGTSVTVSAKGGAINIGGTTAPTGAVAVTTSNVAVTGASATSGVINVTGGSTVNVTQTLVAPNVTGTTGTAYSETGGAVTVNGTATTTSVSVTQTAAVAAVAGVAAVAAVPAVAQVSTVTVGGTIVAGETFTATVNGTNYTYTAVAGDTPTQVAAGLAALAGASSVVTAAASGATVTLTAKTAGTAFTAAGSTNSVAGTESVATPTANVVGVAAVAAKAAVGGIIDGAVSITDLNSSNTDGTKANTITSVTLDGYGAGSTVKTNALSSLTLNNSAKDVTVTDNSAKPTATTLALNINNLASGATLNDATVKTVNISSGAAGSNLALNAAAATALTVAGSGKLTLNLTGATKLASIDGSAATGALTLGTASTVSAAGTTSLSSTVTSVMTGAGNDVVVLKTATSAAVAATSTTAAVAAVNATVSTGAGNDTVDVTLVTGNGNISVAAGDGNDTIIVNQSQLVAGNMFDGGAGSDTLVLVNGTAALAAGDYALINATVANVETLEFRNAIGGVDASKLAFTGYTFDNTAVITNVSTQALTTTGTALTATASGYVAGTTYAGNLNVTSTNAGATLTLNADTATVNVKSTTSVAANAIVAGDLQTSLTVNLTNAANNATASAVTGDNLSVARVLVDGTNNTALKSIVLTGAGTVNIDASVSKSLTSVDASQLGGTIANGTTKGNITGGLNYQANANIAETITLGSGHDVITTASSYGKMDTIIGFDAARETSTGASTSDVLIITAAETGGAALTLDGLTALTGTQTTVPGTIKLTLGAADTTLDLAFVHAAAVAGNNVVQFQFGGNTYLFADTNHNGTLDNGDFAIKLVGLVDLTGAFGIPPQGA